MSELENYVMTQHDRELPLERPVEGPMCPVCGKECETVYKDKESTEIVGCNVCLGTVEAAACADCFQ